MENKLTNYRPWFKSESFGEHSFGIEINISVDHEVTDDEKRAVYQAKDILNDAIMAGNAASDPASLEEAKTQRSDLLGLFPSAEFFEELPNGYCSRGCCKHLPWFRVMTRIGPVEIGWCKRVINIDWSKSMLKLKSKDIFPVEFAAGYPTTGDYYIHAYGVEKAREYVSKIIGASA